MSETIEVSYVWDHTHLKKSSTMISNLKQETCQKESGCIQQIGRFQFIVELH